MPFSFVISFLTPQGSHISHRNDFTLLGGVTRLARHRLDAVLAQIQHTRCDQIIEETLHHDFVTLLFV